MKKITRTRILIPLACLLAGLFLALPAMGQEDLKVLQSDAFETHRRGPVPFDHEAHNAAAGLDDCSVCHHMWEEGELVEGADSAGIPCVDCHGVEAEGDEPNLMQAYHRQCMNCHDDMNKGPVTCGECHLKGEAPADEAPAE